MKPTTRLVYIFAILILPGLSISQELLIQYDFQSKDISYFVEDEEIDRPAVREGQAIRLQVINYNNYLYDVKIEERFNERKIGGNQFLGDMTSLNPTEFLGEFTNQPGIIVNDSDADGVVDFFDDEPDTPLGSGVILTAPPAITDEASLELWKEYERSKILFEKEMLEIEKERLRIENERRKEEMIQGFISQVESGLSKLESFEELLDDLEDEILDIKDQEHLVQNAAAKVDELKYNPYIPTSTIKSQGTQILTDAMDLDVGEEIDFTDLDDNDYHLKNIEELHAENLEDRRVYENKLNDLDILMNELQELAAERSNVIVASKRLNLIKADTNSFRSRSGAIENELNELESYFNKRDPEMIKELWYNYQDLKTNSFTKTHYSRADLDEVVFDIKLVLKQGVSKDDIPDNIVIDPISIPVYGGFKINTSVGVSFAQFLDPLQNYFVKDNVIVAQDADTFLPFITSFMHFYYQGRRSTALGGSLGVGIPLGGSTGFESASFFLGPSLFIGSSNRLIINAGVMGGKVERLGAGYLVGDPVVAGQSVIPLQAHYDLGIYFGLSFNLGK